MDLLRSFFFSWRTLHMLRFRNARTYFKVVAYTEKQLCSRRQQLPSLLFVLFNYRFASSLACEREAFNPPSYSKVQFPTSGIITTLSPLSLLFRFNQELKTYALNRASRIAFMFSHFLNVNYCTCTSSSLDCVFGFASGP